MQKNTLLKYKQQQLSMMKENIVIQGSHLHFYDIITRLYITIAVALSALYLKDLMGATSVPINLRHKLDKYHVIIVSALPFKTETL